MGGETCEAVSNKGKASNVMLLGTKDGEIQTKRIVESETTKERYHAGTKGNTAIHGEWDVCSMISCPDPRQVKGSAGNRL